jgi:hypothetical protein
MYQELLQRNGIVAMRKNMDPLYDRYWRPVLPFARHFTLWVKQSDLARARQVLHGIIRANQLIAYEEDDALAE